MLHPDNPWYPLPADYADLTEDGQKEARLAALKRQNTPMELVAAWDLFRRLYLQPTEPGFFYHSFTPSPKFHYELIYDAGNYARNIVAAPRGFAKSVVMGTELPLLLALTRSYLRILVSLSTETMLDERFSTFMIQLTENPYIINDFGHLKPPRAASRIWNHELLQLANGSQIKGYSVRSRKRGARADVFLLDDPEYDSTSGSSLSNDVILREQFQQFLFKQVIPMLEKGSVAFWIGTMISRQSSLYHACYEDDERFTYWNRRVYSALYPSEKDPSKVSLLWSNHWDADFLKVREKEIGRSHFLSEYMNAPGNPEDRILRVDPILNEYVIDGQDEMFAQHPLSMVAPLNYYRYDRAKDKWENITVASGVFFKKLYRMITFDPSEGLGSQHDYSCLVVSGLDRENCLWVLDMWMGRAPNAALLNIIYKYGLKWRPKVIGVESNSIQIQLADAMGTIVKDRGQTTNWMPAVVPVDYTKTASRKSKSDRISTLEWRFDAGKIKYPKHLSGTWPFNALYTQTKDYTYDLALLSHDDAIDTVAMVHFMIHGQGSKDVYQRPGTTMIEKIQAGDVCPGGLPIISGYSSQTLPQEIIDALLDRGMSLVYNEKTRDKHNRYAFQNQKPRFDGKRSMGPYERYSHLMRSQSGDDGTGLLLPASAFRAAETVREDDGTHIPDSSANPGE